MHFELPLAAFATAALLALAPRAFPVPQDPLSSNAPSSVIPVPRTDQWAIEREKEVLRRARETKSAKVVFLGDSITQGWEGEGREFWEERFAKIPALNLGNSGDRTEHVLYRLREAPIGRLSPEHVVLLIGTNNLGHGSSNADETLLGVKSILAILREQCDATIHVLEIFPRGERMNAMRGDILQINQALRAYVEAENKKAKQGRERLRIHAIGDLFVDGKGEISKDLMPDALHLSKEGYRIWGEALLPAVSK